MSDRTFYSVFLAFFCGVFVFSFISANLVLVIFCVVISLAVIFYCFIYKIRSAVFLVFLTILSFFLGSIRVELAEQRSHILDLQVGIDITLHGFICDEPQDKETSQRFCFAPDKYSDRMIVSTDRYPRYEYGERLTILGKLEFPENFEAYEGGPIFNYIAHLEKDGIRYLISRPKIEMTGENVGFFFKKLLFNLKGAFVRKMQYLFPEPESSLLGGILLGERSSIPKDVTDDFKRAGLIHILVLSGYNVSIVAESFMKAFSFLPRLFASSFGALSIVLFAIMTGASATTVRASIMALIVIGSRTVSRKYDIGRALLLAAFVMIVGNPMILAFDVSFQLSFIATIGIVYVSPFVSEKLTFITERFNLKEVIASTLGTQIFVTPFLLYSMGELSIISLVSNIFALPFIPYSMLLGFLAITVGFFLDAIALPLAWITRAMLSFIIFVAHTSSEIPFASVRIQTSVFGLVCMYTLLLYWIISSWKKRNSSPQSSS